MAHPPAITWQDHPQLGGKVDESSMGRNQTKYNPNQSPQQWNECQRLCLQQTMAQYSRQGFLATESRSTFCQEKCFLPSQRTQNLIDTENWPPKRNSKADVSSLSPSSERTRLINANQPSPTKKASSVVQYVGLGS